MRFKLWICLIRSPYSVSLIIIFKSTVDNEKPFRYVDFLLHVNFCYNVKDQTQSNECFFSPEKRTPWSCLDIQLLYNTWQAHYPFPNLNKEHLISVNSSCPVIAQLQGANF